MTNILYEILKTMTGYKSLKRMPNGSTWVKLVSEETAKMHDQIDTLKSLNHYVEIIKDEPLTEGSRKQYITFYVD